MLKGLQTFLFKKHEFNTLFFKNDGPGSNFWKLYKLSHSE